MSVICYLVNPRGFCSGVNRAVSMADQVLRLYKEIYIIEDIIHNKVFMKDMSERGIKKVRSVDDIPDGSVVMFSAHGVAPDLVSACEKKGLTIVDATCPIVSRVQKSVRQSAKEGKTIIIIGHRSHPEIVGLVGCTNNKDVFVVSDEGEIDILPDMTGKSVVYYTQTTLDRNFVKRIVDTLKIKVPHVESEKENNICCATTERQDAIRSIAPKMDLVIVVGSKYSSNTMRLAEVSKDAGAKSVIRIDSADELDEQQVLKGVKTIAVTSGASAPEYVIRGIVDYLINTIGDLVIKEVNNKKDSDECEQ